MMAVVNRIAVTTRMSSHFLFIGFTAIPVFGVCLMCTNWPVKEVNQVMHSIIEAFRLLKCQPVRLHHETHT